MASWRDSMQRGSFRGASFGIFEASLEGGRRTVSHEYPQRDYPCIEDLGRKARSYSVEAFVVGDDYMTSRDALKTALELGGSGILAHPYYGTLVLFVDTYSIRESRDDGGMATFSITFLQEQPIVYPAVSQSAASTLATTITSTQTNSAAALVAGYAPGSGAVAIQAASDVTNSLSIIQTQTTLKVRAASSIIDSINGQVNAYDAFMRDTAALAANVTTLITTSEQLAYSVIDIVGRMGTMTDTPTNAVVGYSAMFSALGAYFSGLSFLITTTGAAQQANSNILRDVLLLAVATSAATAGIQIDFDTLQDALSIQGSITGMLDTFMDSAVDDTMFESALDLRMSIVKAIPPEGDQLSDVTTISIQTTLPSLALAWHLSGALDIEADIIARNDIRNPWAIQGGNSIQVLL